MSFYVGEALSGDGNEIAHIDLLIGDKSGPVLESFGHDRRLLVFIAGRDRRLRHGPVGIHHIDEGAPRAALHRCRWYDNGALRRIDLEAHADEATRP